jgi:CDP-diacylglycerol--glycerol-3-phosphate 3-phosphatidyltransferase
MKPGVIRDWLRKAMFRYFEGPAVQTLVLLRVPPNLLTVVGFIIALGAACLAGFGMFLIAGFVFLSASVLDMLDGGLARATNRVTPAGALLDSVTDRISEGAMLAALVVEAALADMGESRLMATIVLLVGALLFSQTVSYIRARGEGLGISSKEGLMTRPERVVLLSAGLMLQGVGLDPALLVCVGVVAGFSLMTTVQRFIHVRAHLGQKE